MNPSDRQVTVRMKLPDTVRADLDVIGRLAVPRRAGPMMLANLATISLESGPAQTDRLNRARDVRMDVEPSGASLGEVSAAAARLPIMQNPPAQLEATDLGDMKETAGLFASFCAAMLTGVLCIYCVLVLLFTDFMQVVTIQVSLPLSISAA